MKPAGSFFWRKLDGPGHDSCRLFRLPNGWRLAGAAVFHEDNRPCHFQYEVVVDTAWRTRRAAVSGYLGNKEIRLKIAAAAAVRNRQWRVGDDIQKNLTGCVDVDLGFTPSTNLIVLNRLALAVGEYADAPAAYLKFPGMRFVTLPQTYHRIGATEYAYEAPTVGYAGTLQVLPSGAVAHYPKLFELYQSRPVT
ncbi:putative glycolipid-binding domain-containing protein [Noviherbaspirillum saxi]|nr:putative glycolipid-binding domain-containing protein [Noviherbaspirillum saxi]